MQAPRPKAQPAPGRGLAQVRLERCFEVARAPLAAARPQRRPSNSAIPAKSCSEAANAFYDCTSSTPARFHLKTILSRFSLAHGLRTQKLRRSQQVRRAEARGQRRVKEAMRAMQSAAPGMRGAIARRQPAAGALPRWPAAMCRPNERARRARNNHQRGRRYLCLRERALCRPMLQCLSTNARACRRDAHARK